MNDTLELLSRSSYLELFQRMDDDEKKKILATPDALAHLAAHARDGSAATATRFLAAELLFDRDPQYPPADDARALAALYARALAETDEGNRWGLPGQWSGPAGEHLQRLGKAAIEPLEALLTDGRVVRFVGSKEATAGNAQHLRVKDFAAWFIAGASGLRWVVDADPARRDPFIEDLRRHATH